MGILGFFRRPKAPARAVVGARVRIEYADQNEEFAAKLPRSGTVSNELAVVGDTKRWFLVELDDPFEYQIRLGHEFEFRILNCDRLLIASRHVGHEIGEPEPTGVFIFLVLDEGALRATSIELERFYHVAWGMCHTEQAPPSAALASNG